MRRPNRLPRRLLTRPFEVGDALAGGVSRRRLRNADLDRPFHGVRSADPAGSCMKRCAAYATIMPHDHVFSHATAATLHGIPLPVALERSTDVHVTALRNGRAPRGRGVVGHSTGASHVIWLIGGLAVLSAADTWCSLGGSLSLDDLIAAGDRLVGLPAPLATFEEIDEAIGRHGNRRGARMLRRARAEMRAGSHSRPETLSRLALVRAGLPEPELNTEIVLRSGRRTRGDLVFREYKALVEYDGEHHLLDADQWAADVRRLNDLAADGWIIIRATKRMPRAELVDRAIRALEDRGWRAP